MRLVSRLLTLCLAACCGLAAALPQTATQPPAQASAPANGAAQVPAPRQGDAPSRDAAPLPALVPAPPVPLLWKVSDADNALYLLGSFHLLEPDDYPLSPDVDAAFADSKRVLFEMPPGEMQSPTLAVRMGQAALRTDGTVLDSELPPQTVASLDAWLAANRDGLQAMALTPAVTRAPTMM